MLFAYISLYLKWKINIYVRWNYWLQSEIFCLRLRFNGLGILVGVNEYVNCRKCVTFLSMSVNLIIIEESVLNRLVAVKIIKSIAWLSCERRMCYCEWRSFIYIYIWFTNLLSLREESISRDSMKYELHKKRNCVASMIYAMDSSQ